MTQNLEVTMSKLYTEEQVRKAWTTAYIDALALDDEDYKPKFYDDFIASLTPIELPTDEEIEEASNNLGYGSRSVGIIHNAFQVGAKWMRDKIKGGGDE